MMSNTVVIWIKDGDDVGGAGIVKMKREWLQDEGLVWYSSKKTGVGGGGGWGAATEFVRRTYLTKEWGQLKMKG